MQENFEDIPFPEYENEQEEEINEIYLAIWLIIIAEILRLATLPNNLTSQYLMRMEGWLTRRIQIHFAEMNTNMSKVVRPLITDAYIEGSAYTKISNGYRPEQFPVINKDNYSEALEVVKDEVKEEIRKSSRQYVIEQLIKDTQNDLLQATHNTEENIKKLIRSTVADVMQNNLLPVKKQDLEKEIKEKLTKNALEQKIDQSQIAIIDKANRRWKLGTYINMVVRTKVASTYIKALQDQAEEQGFDLAIISSHPLTVDECKNYEGMIISLNGRTEGYPTYAELKRSKMIFHPNCRHFCRPIPNLRYVPVTHKKKHEEQMKKYNDHKERNSI